MIESGKSDQNIILLDDDQQGQNTCKHLKFSYVLVEIKLRFLFADTSLTNIYLTTNLSKTVTEIKGLLLSELPKSMENVSNIDQLRLFCLGKELKTSASYWRKEITLLDLKLPKYSDYPTPINVAITSLNKKQSSTSEQIKLNCCCITVSY